MRLCTLAILLLALDSPVGGVDSTVDPSPRVHKAEAKSADIDTELTFQLGEPVIVRADVDTKAVKHSIRWRVRGDVEYETFAGDTVLVVGWKPGRYEAEFLFIDFDKGSYEEERFVILMGDKPPPGPVVVVPDVPMPKPDTTDKVDRVTVVFEKDKGAVSLPVAKALTLLNRQGVFATEFEVDTVDGDNETPQQYQIAKEAAEREGLPAAVFQVGSKVVKTIRLSESTTTEEITEAANANR